MLKAMKTGEPHTGNSQTRLDQDRKPGEDLARRVGVVYNCIPIQSAIEQDGNQSKTIQVVNLRVDTAGTRNYPSRKPGWERSDTGRNARSASG